MYYVCEDEFHGKKQPTVTGGKCSVVPTPNFGYALEQPKEF